MPDVASYDVFTPERVSEKMVSYFKTKVRALLEPSVGTGNLLLAMDGKYESADVYDINAEYLASLDGRSNVRKHHSNFITSEIGGGGLYDGIILNPPYHRFQDMEETMRKSIKDLSPMLASGNMDLYVAFLYKCIQLLSADGTLVAIVPSSWLYNASCRLFRDYLHVNRLIREIHDYGSEKVFSGVSVYCCILVVDRFEKTHYNHNSEEISYDTPPETSQPALGALASIRNGVATLCDKIFIHDAPPFEEPCWKPIFKVSKNVVRYIMYPYNADMQIVPEEEFRTTNPRTYAYLCENRRLLDQRDKGKKVYQAWYAWGRRQGLSVPECDECVYMSTMVSPECPTTVKQAMLFYSGIQITPNENTSGAAVQECIYRSRDEIARKSSKRGSGWLNISTRVLSSLPMAVPDPA
jgi:hypothetical protein